MIRKAEKQSQCLRSGGTEQRRSEPATKERIAKQLQMPSTIVSAEPGIRSSFVAALSWTDVVYFDGSFICWNAIQFISWRNPARFKASYRRLAAELAMAGNADGSNDQRQSPKIAWSGSEICFTLLTWCQCSSQSMRGLVVLIVALVALSAIVWPNQPHFAPQPTRAMPAVNIP